MSKIKSAFFLILIIGVLMGFARKPDKYIPCYNTLSFDDSLSKKEVLILSFYNKQGFRCLSCTQNDIDSINLKYNCIYFKPFIIKFLRNWDLQDGNAILTTNERVVRIPIISFFQNAMWTTPVFFQASGKIVLNDSNGVFTDFSHYHWFSSAKDSTGVMRDAEYLQDGLLIYMKKIVENNK